MSETVIDRLIVTLGLNAVGYKQGGQQAQKVNKDLREDASMTAKHLDEKGKLASSFFSAIKIEALGLFAVLGLGGKGLTDIVFNSGAAAAAIGRFAQVTNTTPAKLTGLQNVAKEYGSTAEAVSGAMQSIYGSITDFQTTGQPNAAVGALRYMGINAVGKDGQPRDTSDIMLQVAEYFKTHSKGLDRTLGLRLGIDPTLTNALIQAPDIAKLVAQQASISDAAAKKGEALITAEGKLNAAMSTLDADIMTNLAPAFVGLINVITTLVNWLDGKEKTSAANNLPPDTPKGHYIRRDGKVEFIPNSGAPLPNITEGDVTDAQWQAQLQAESGGAQSYMGKPVTSSAGAIGIAQLLPSTARDVAAKHGIPWNETQFQIDGQYNSMLGRLYMNDQMQKYKGNVAEALAAYNSGPGAVDADIAKAAKNGGSFLDYAPKETQDYVHKIMGSKSYGSTKELPTLTALLGHSVSRSHASSSKPSVVNVGGVTIHTKATDASGISKSVAAKLQSLRALQANKGVTY